MYDDHDDRGDRDDSDNHAALLGRQLIKHVQCLALAKFNTEMYDLNLLLESADHAALLEQ